MTAAFIERAVLTTRAYADLLTDPAYVHGARDAGSPDLQAAIRQTVRLPRKDRARVAVACIKAEIARGES